MAINNSQAPASGVWNAIQGALNIFSGINKADGVTENSNAQPADAFESSMTELEITELVSAWKRQYTAYYSDVESSQKTSFEYWIGKQTVDEAEAVQGNRPLVDNLIFEAIETFIPIATRANPDPLVNADPSDIGQKLAHDLTAAIVHEADRQKFRKKLKGMLRNWIICKIGVLKFSYNVVLDRIETDVVNPRRMLFDKDGYIDEAGHFTGEWTGEKKKASADRLVDLFPKKEKFIMEKAGGKKGTKLEYIEWWYQGKHVFYTMEEIVLGKFLNPHWNYDSDDGIVQGQNHLDEPMAPYVFLSIFSTGIQPHDETSLVSQNIGLQDMINRRYRQIDDNVRKMNNGLVVGSMFTDSQASQAAAALARGTAIRVPQGDVTKAVMRLPAPALPAAVFDMLNDGREQVKNLFGTSGSTPSGIDQEQTVRGKILVNQLDSSRIGGGITEYLEQVADSSYNWWFQIMLVHWTDPHFVIAAGQQGGQDLISIKNTDFFEMKTINITVKEGSLIPKDPLTQRNEAIDLWSAGAIDPITFFTRLDSADPVRDAEQLLTWQMVQKGQLPPQAYIPTFMQDQQASGQVMPGAGATPIGSPNDIGGPAVNPVGPPTPDANAPAPTSVPEQKNQEHQLIQSVPAK